MGHGKSKSQENPNGVRSRSHGNERAPKALRRIGKKWLSECTDEELERVSQVKRV